MNRAGNSSTVSQACAACKYQRRKCAPNCPLAHFFPPSKQKDFLNVHKLFGVSNIMKIIQNLDPSSKEIAINSMIFQANVRANDPVGGCYHIIWELQREIEHGKAELEMMRHHIGNFRSHFASKHIEIEEEHTAGAIHRQNTNADPLNTYNRFSLQPVEYTQPVHFRHQQQQQREENYHHFRHQQQQQREENYHPKQEYNVHDRDSVLSSLHGKQLLDDCEDIKPLLGGGIFDEREPLPFDSKELIQCSDKAVLKDYANSIQHEQEHDQKGATSTFSLTNGKESKRL